MTEIERIEKYIAKTKFDSTHYELLLNETLDVMKMAAEKPIEAIWLAFNYGRAKGYRAAKKEVTA